ncbi:MAG: hypothetical protein ABGZ35_01070 [Planctomycetaceae bacterium]
MITPKPSLRAILFLAAFLSGRSAAFAQLDFERAPFNYTTATPTDSVTRLEESLNSGESTLEFSSAHGYLDSLLQQLNIPVSSQVLVFSKTSFQRHHISPATPRALYFSDDVYVGWVQHGDVIDLSAADPNLGAVFYTLDQESAQNPQFQRQTDHCLSCHGSVNTRRVPGHVVRSVFPDSNGLPLLRAGTFRTDHASPFRERWGGWYVTGTHGRDRHMGNVIAHSKEDPEQLDVEAGANISDLSEIFNLEPYLTGHSDIVALMVLEHQTTIHNRLTEAMYAGRSAIHDCEIMNRALERPTDFVSDSTKRRFESAANKVVDNLLMKGEYRLMDPVHGSGQFAQGFAARGPFDSQDRSLRQFDLEQRLFRYPLSYLIYSRSFDALPAQVRRIVYRQLWEILKSTDSDDDYQHISKEDRTAIWEILSETKSDLPAYWRG